MHPGVDGILCWLRKQSTQVSYASLLGSLQINLLELLIRAGLQLDTWLHALSIWAQAFSFIAWPWAVISSVLVFSRSWPCKAAVGRTRRPARKIGVTEFIVRSWMHVSREDICVAAVLLKGSSLTQTEILKMHGDMSMRAGWRPHKPPLVYQECHGNQVWLQSHKLAILHLRRPYLIYECILAVVGLGFVSVKATMLRHYLISSWGSILLASGIFSVVHVIVALNVHLFARMRRRVSVLADVSPHRLFLAFLSPPSLRRPQIKVEIL